MKHTKRLFKSLTLLTFISLPLVACTPSSQETYTVIFNPNGGERIGGGELIQNFSSNEDIVAPTLERVGYTFSSWDKDFSSLTTDSVITASWVINQYDVSYASNDLTMGSVSGNGTRFDYGSLVSVIATPNEGYVFDGWYEGEALKTVYANYSFLIKDSNVSLIAKFSKNNNVPYKVFHYKQNINDDLYTLAETNTLYGTTNENTVAQAHDYEGFDAKAFSQVTINGNRTTEISIYYDRKTFNVNFMANGDGSLSKSLLTVKYGTEIRKDGDTVIIGNQEVKATPTTKDGQYTYGFVNWTNASGVVTEDKTITANFSKTDNVYKVTFDIGNYGITPCYEEVLYNSKVTQPVTQSATGVTFKGWYKEKECLNEWDFDVDTIKKDTTIYGAWNLIEYSISYVYPTDNYYAYSLPEGYVNTYNIETPTFNLPELESRKTNFKGWFDNSSYTGSVVTSIEKGSTGNKTFYTNGSGMEIKCNITFNNCEGVSGLGNPYFYIDALYYLPTPKKDFYQFDGWYSESSFTNKVTTIDTSYKHDVVLYAKWTELTILNITASCSYNDYKIGKKASYTMSTKEAVVKAHLSNDTYLTLTPKYNSEITYSIPSGYQFTNADLNPGETSSTKTVNVSFRGFSASFNITVRAREFNVNWDTILYNDVSLVYSGMSGTIYSNTASYTIKVKSSDSQTYNTNYKVTFGNTVIKNTTNFTLTGDYTTLTFDIDTSVLEAAILADPDATIDELPTLKITINKI